MHFGDVWEHVIVFGVCVGVVGVRLVGCGVCGVCGWGVCVCRGVNIIILKLLIVYILSC